MIKLSVIVPIYNEEKYLSRCLDSLLNQDVENYEIVCVNDGSTDGSGVILQEYQKNNPQLIRIVEQRNQGLSAARNAGMAVARGTIIAFCDADDFLIPGAYGFLLSHFWKEGVDVLKYKSITLDRYVQKKWIESNALIGDILYEGRGFTFMIDREPNFSFVWSCLYRKQFLEEHNIRFISVKQCEDVEFNLEVYMCDPYVVAVSSNVYRYTVSEGQITRIREPHYVRGVVDSYLRLFSNMNKYIQTNPELGDTLVFYKQREMVSCMSRVLSANYTRREFCSIKSSFQELGVLPMLHSERTSRIVNAIMVNFLSYSVASFFYRLFFIPYILPRLGRN